MQGEAANQPADWRGCGHENGGSKEASGCGELGAQGGLHTEDAPGHAYPAIFRQALAGHRRVHFPGVRRRRRTIRSNW